MLQINQCHSLPSYSQVIERCEYNKEKILKLISQDKNDENLSFLNNNFNLIKSSILVKQSQNVAFNHVYVFLFFPNNPNSIYYSLYPLNTFEKDFEWKKFIDLPFKVREISCDSNYLAIMDESGNIWRRIITEEYRTNKKKDYTVVGTIECNKWREYWNYIPFLQKKRKLNFDEKDIIKWSISQRGYFTLFYQAWDNREKEPEGPLSPIHNLPETTLFALEKSGKRIFWFDPFVNLNYPPITIISPDTPTSSFVIKQMDVSANTIVIIGYETNQQENNLVPLKIYSRIFDAKVMGWIYSLKYRYYWNNNFNQKKLAWNWTLIQEESTKVWKHHPLPLGNSFSFLSILSTGVGPKERFIRIVDEKKQIWEKCLYSDQWKIVANNFIPIVSKNDNKANQYNQYLPIFENIYNYPFSTLVKNYKGFFIFRNEIFQAELLNFSKELWDWNVEFKDISDENKIKNWRIHKRLNFYKLNIKTPFDYYLLESPFQLKPKKIKNILIDQKFIFFEFQKKDFYFQLI